MTTIKIRALRWILGRVISAIAKREGSQLQAKDFMQSNIRVAEDQTVYGTLPMYAEPGAEDGQKICCFKLTKKQRLLVLLTGRVWLHVLTFNKPLQPVALAVESPWRDDAEQSVWRGEFN